jgi:hypothetical protein
VTRAALVGQLRHGRDDVETGADRVIEEVVDQGRAVGLERTISTRQWRRGSRPRSTPTSPGVPAAPGSRCSTQGRERLCPPDVAFLPFMGEAHVEYRGRVTLEVTPAQLVEAGYLVLTLLVARQ